MTQAKTKIENLNNSIAVLIGEEFTSAKDEVRSAIDRVKGLVEIGVLTHPQKVWANDIVNHLSRGLNILIEAEHSAKPAPLALAPPEKITHLKTAR